MTKSSELHSTSSKTAIAVDYDAATKSGEQGPRAAMARAAALAASVLATVTPADTERPTPCAEWNVLDLSQHIVSVLHRAAAAPSGVDIMAMPLLADCSVDQLDTEVQLAASEIQSAWADDAALDMSFSMPWGEFDGATLLGTYAGETVVHSWDLAAALGVAPNWPEDDVAMYLAIAEVAVPADMRNEFVPFEAVVECDAAAPAIERLVAWQGRKVHEWTTVTA